MKTRETLEIGVAFAILASVAAFAYRSAGVAEETLGWVQHTHQVLEQLGDATGAYARVVAPRRAYVVAGDESQLGEVPALDARLGEDFDVVRASMADNPAQRRRVDALAGLIQSRVADLDAAVARRRRDGTGVETAADLALASKIRAAREEIEAEENRLLAEREATTRRNMATTKVGEIVGTLLSIGILILAVRRLRYEITRRRESEQFLDSIIENVPNMIFIKEPRELRFERINRAGEELLGIDRQALLRKNDFDLFPPEQATFFQERDRDTFVKGKVVDIAEEPIQTKRGERWLHTKKVPVVDDQGHPRFLLGISEDITELREATTALRVAKNATEVANRELEAFSYSVAHDLRAPLRAIHGFSLAIEEDYGDKLDETGKSHLQRVRRAAESMAELIDGLLGLSRVARGDLVRERVDLTRLARECGARLRELDPTRDVQLVVESDMVAEGDARLLTAALENLIGNAWKFTAKRADARIEVGKRSEEGRTVFFVKDNGAGFDQAYAHKLFGAFQRLHAGSEFEGTGIGLATVQRIISKHGGSISAHGEVGRGATFSFTL